MHTGPHSQKLVDCRARGEFTKAVGPLRQELHKVLRSILGQACHKSWSQKQDRHYVCGSSWGASYYWKCNRESSETKNHSFTE
eukprot:scaffold180140_cov19-Tisochrysis_lutea.AAC.1